VDHVLFYDSTIKAATNARNGISPFHAVRRGFAFSRRIKFNCVRTWSLRPQAAAMELAHGIRPRMQTGFGKPTSLCAHTYLCLYACVPTYLAGLVRPSDTSGGFLPGVYISISCSHQNELISRNAAYDDSPSQIHFLTTILLLLSLVIMRVR